MPFSSAAKELISVLSRYKSSEQSVRWLPRGICELVREPTRDCERRNKFFVNQCRLQLNSGIWDYVQVERSGHSAVLLPVP